MITLGLALTVYLLAVAAVLTYKAVTDRDLLKAVIYSAGQSVAYGVAYAVLMAPDVLLAYIAVGMGIYPVIMIYAISKTRRFEEGGSR